MGEWTIGAVLDAIADAAPDRLMTICGTRRSTFGESAERTRCLANFLAGQGLGAHRERAELENWECGQDRVALLMHNDLYPDMVIGSLKARTVPVNVNYNYAPREVAELLEYLRPRAVIYHRSFGPKFADVLPPATADVLIAVDDGGSEPLLPGAIGLEEALAQGDTDRDIRPSPDDVMMVCTGGTTGRPKGVMWRQSDTYVVSMNGADHESVDEIHAKLGLEGQPWFAVSPLMHAAGMWTAFAGLLNGLPIVLYDKTRFDPRAVLETAEREKVGMMTMVGDAYAAPLVDELRSGTYDLSSMYAIGTGGAATNPKHQQALLELLPQITLINGYGSSETGNVGFGRSQHGEQKDTFVLREGALVLSEDYTRFLEPGEQEVGFVARAGRIPLGYFDDEAATRKTFPVVDGKRVVISGDRGSLAPDGTLRLFGRDSLVVNTGGEKVFVEEVEEVLRAYAGVADALVVGRPSERWGQELVALVALQPGVDITSEQLHDQCTSQLARFKAPKEFIIVDQVRRLGNGKPDYRWAKATAAQEASLT
ncbi:acyl-CoA synthetase [Mycolicibacterium moriokaense]|jgi:fatty-acyl-CoA synthase|uniref:Acyl-CoA synthetase n=1 Tax=Mycolicibacterium moriokaense TaxID=39691 RepID=A0AAD1HDR9_9MYCO|nr:acyl-CoA synthetase [Mycolicibacterium moriokaense]MCV7038827.1 acyl-CoA synthetase [Mycolicibacterium moriokaense]ORB25423.1 acyl-CoA synthetase [Mycolicibacterium moriokaense]BBX03562.1 acyl-CoA synthetase [Mycolicibacterium moriokaense]